VSGYSSEISRVRGFTAPPVQGRFKFARPLPFRWSLLRFCPGCPSTRPRKAPALSRVRNSKGQEPADPGAAGGAPWACSRSLQRVSKPLRLSVGNYFWSPGFVWAAVPGAYGHLSSACSSRSLFVVLLFCGEFWSRNAPG